MMDERQERALILEYALELAAELPKAVENERELSRIERNAWSQIHRLAELHGGAQA